MPRDNEQKHWALVKLLREFDISNDLMAYTRADDQDKAALRRDLTIAFSTGWDDAQKWEASEAQRQGIAVQAMNGLLANSNRSMTSAESIATQSYAMADAMMIAAKEGVSKP